MECKNGVAEGLPPNRHRGEEEKEERRERRQRKESSKGGAEGEEGEWGRRKRMKKRRPRGGGGRGGMEQHECSHGPGVQRPRLQSHIPPGLVRLQ